ncbi:MAG TPA: ATP-binding cassette domain-containing protein [Planktothrix sp.]|jgi:phospholipid/cholesterol/gamma-HCH transport system ATP-binding protein
MSDEIPSFQPVPDRPAKRSDGKHDGEPLISVRNLHKSFGDKHVIRGINFDVWGGETVGIIGPSGCGKSTILKLLCGLLQPDSGEITLRSQDVGLVFQGSALLNSLTVGENLALPLRMRDMKPAEKERTIQEKLSLVGLGDYLDAYPTQLSGGQQKRTGFARAIVNNPRIILYDEPTTGLDPVMSTIVEDYIIKLEEELRAASIVVTHQYSTWTRTADRIIMMFAGNIVWQGDPNDAIGADNAYMRQFVHATRQGPMASGAV